MKAQQEGYKSFEPLAITIITNLHVVVFLTLWVSWSLFYLIFFMKKLLVGMDWS